MGGPTQVVEETCSEKILFMSGPVRFSGPFSGANLRFSERVVWLMRLGAFLPMFWLDCFVFLSQKCR